MADWQVEELAVPAIGETELSADFVAGIEIINQTEAEAYGHDELRLRPAEMLPWWQDPANPHRPFGVRVDGTLVGVADFEWLESDADGCWLRVSVLAAHRSQGIGSALAAHCEAIAAAAGRKKVIAYFPSPDTPGERITAPTGFGSVPSDNPEVRFAVGRGYRLEQVERGSRLTLPVAVTVDPPADYRLHFWVDTTPPQWLEQMAVLYTRMSTDAPSAGLEEPEDVYTAERVAEQDAAIARNPRSYLHAAVEHIPTGTLAGYTTLSVPVEPERTVNQYATLVLKEHRGNRLGMLLKVANIDHLQRTRPGHPSIITFNAEENRFMLDVNEAVGFVPMGHEGAWRKDLD